MNLLFGQRHLAVDLILDLVSEELVVQVDRHRLLVNCKHLHGVLHAVEARRLPDKVDAERLSAVAGDAYVGLQL